MIGFLAAIGRGTTRWLARVGALARFAFETVASTTSLPRAGRGVALRILLNQLSPVLATADSLMRETRGRIGGLHDSLTATLVEARQLMDNLDTLAHAATLVAVENRERIRQTAENIRVVSIKMEYLMDQLSRRPLKVIGGVKPLSHDSIVAQWESVTVKK